MPMKMFHPNTTILLKNCARTSARTQQSSFPLHKKKITLTPSPATGPGHTNYAKEMTG